jgi:hypothetical protein
MRTKSSSKRAAGESNAKRGTNQRRHVLTGASKRPLVPIAQLSERSQAARDRALHVLAAMRRDPELSLTHASKLQGVKPATVRKYLSGALRSSHGKLRVAKSDRFTAALNIPDSTGKAAVITTHSSKERKEASRYLRDLGRSSRGKRGVLREWKGKKIGGVEVFADEHALASIEPLLSEFSLYRATNGGAG